MIKTDFSGIDGFSLSPQFDKAEKACRDVADPGGIYADYNGWVGLPDTISENLSLIHILFSAHMFELGHGIFKALFSAHFAPG